MYPQPPQDSTLIPVYNNDDREKQEQEISSWLKALADGRVDPKSTVDDNIDIFKTMVDKYYDNQLSLKFVCCKLEDFTELLITNFNTCLETCLGNETAIKKILTHFDQNLTFAQKSVSLIESLLLNQQSEITHKQLPVSLTPVGGQLSQQDGFGEAPSSPRADQEQASLSSFPPPLGLDNIPINADRRDTKPRAIEISQPPLQRDPITPLQRDPITQGASSVKEKIEFFERRSNKPPSGSSSPLFGSPAQITGSAKGTTRYSV